MRYIGIGASHDAGIAIFDETGNLELLVQAERWNRRKHATWLPMDWVPANFNLELTDDDVVVLSSIVLRPKQKPFSWIKELVNVAGDVCGYPEELVRTYEPITTNNKIKEVIGVNPKWCIDHHLCHALASWAFRPDDETRLFMAYDGSGPDAIDSFKSSLVGEFRSDGFSLYKDALPIPSSGPIELLGWHSTGKVMGMSGYVEINRNIWTEAALLRRYLQLALEQSVSFPRELWMFIPDMSKMLSRTNMEFVGNFYNWYVNDFIWPSLEINYQTFGQKRGVVIGGGTSLALELNTRLHSLSGDLVFGPPADDSGLALGAACFAYFMVNKKWPNRLNTASLNALSTPLPRIGPQTPVEIAKLLNEDHVVCLLRNKSEAGPRALGFRSILASAKNRDNLSRVSCEIKGRESYRPLAPAVTEEQFSRFFVGPQGYFMQYRVLCTQEAKQLIPAAVHLDGSSRPQVVTQENDPWFHELLVEYGRLSGVECLINTSLNKAGNPICDSYIDATSDMKEKRVVVISIGSKLYL